MSKGIDIPINDLILVLNTFLWPAKTRAFYGRIFRNEIPNGYSVKIQPLYYGAVGSEPIEVLLDDRNDAQCFVDVMPTRQMFGKIKEAECRLLFMVNLSALYPLLNRTEAIESVIEDVENLVSSSQFQFVRYVSDSSAFADYQWKEDALANLSGSYLFRFDLKLVYNN